ncbi:glutathione peroxidase [Alphaproteobacteria bacterium]|nr:glutathione peroxidase [Alphaproteobacteria bacterium]
MSENIYDFMIDDIDGNEIQLKRFKGSPILLINTASRCGFTGQYQNLANLFIDYKDKGLIIIATPSNSFNQELSNEKEVKNFCLINYQTKFMISGIINVKGNDAHMLYKWIRSEYGKTPKWNFYKFLFNTSGQLEESWSSIIKPDSNKITNKIDKILLSEL